jgi:surfactin synthase thioesterase subunit
MIGASAEEFDALAARLTARAEAIALASPARRRRPVGRASHRWRSAEYLWPGFAKG